MQNNVNTIVLEVRILFRWIVCVFLIYSNINTEQCSGREILYHSSGIITDGSGPDIEECLLGLHNCHKNAICINTADYFICECKHGYTGNGKTVCNKTCSYECVHGECSEAPLYVCLCDIGWTGPKCNDNCGCNNHSSCSLAIGKCDSCQNNTYGDYCEFCLPGSYGDATSKGCQKCDCNGHADPSADYCDSVTGECHCMHDTYGDKCEFCLMGFYGNARNGGRCFRECEGRSLIFNATTGGIGLMNGKGIQDKNHVYCLWVISVFSNLSVSDPGLNTPTITLMIQNDIKVFCTHDYLYIYDGIPELMSAKSAKLLAAFCGYDLRKPYIVEASSGYLTVFFEANIDDTSSSTRGFNAIFRVNDCKNDCDDNRQCIENLCVCKKGFTGIDCSIVECPNDCSNHGYCDDSTGTCRCDKGYGTDDCSLLVSENMILYTTMANANNDTLARMGHSLVTCDKILFYLFGGYSLSKGIFDDLWEFNLSSNTWRIIQPSSDKKPIGRYYHASVCMPNVKSMYIFGGLSVNGEIREMWKFNLDTLRWNELIIDDSKLRIPIPAVAGHTLTAVGKSKLILIGGFSITRYFNEFVYEYDITDNVWSLPELIGAQPTGLYGHSTVWDPNSGALYVFGGFEYQTDKTVISSNLYSLDIYKETWSLLPSEPGNKPQPRYFHSAITMNSYVVILSGRSSHHNYDSTVMAYSFKCNNWINLTIEENYSHGHGIPGVIGSVAVSIPGSQSNDLVIFMCGSDGKPSYNLIKLEIPQDLCTVYSDTTSCLNTLGCASCSVENRTTCYNNEEPRYDCFDGQIISSYQISAGTECNADRIRNQDCYQHDTCTECLAKWPAHNHVRVCQWCSNCPQGKCIPKDGNCDTENKCKRAQRSIININECVERVCQASDCFNCDEKGKCIWTQQFKRSSEVGRTLSLMPIYDWNCVIEVLLDVTSYKIESSPPKECPKRCYEYSDCGSCLDSHGGEGGTQECIWSTYLLKCFPPAYRPLYCSNGECGFVLSGKYNQCPKACKTHTQCGLCLNTPGCGWYSFTGNNGVGVCMEGGIMGAQVIPNEFDDMSFDMYLWSFSKCPPENECLNNHNDCDESESCTDLQIGYTCD